MNLFDLTREQAELEYLLEENGGELTPEIEERLTETAESLPRKVDGYGALIHKFESIEKACDDEIKRIQAIKQTAKNSSKNLKKRVLDCMTTFNFDRLEGVTTKFFVRTTNSLDVNEEVLLAPYQKKLLKFGEKLPAYLTLEVKVSKTLLKDACKASDVLPSGCEMKENKSLTVK